MREHTLLAYRERQGERFHDLARQIVLQLKGIAERDLRGLRPEQPAARCLDQLCRHPHLRPRAKERARDRRVDVQFGGERRQVGRGLEPDAGQG